MKEFRIFIFSFFLLTFAINATPVFGQDLIVLKNAEEIVSKVIEVNVTEIKYKKWNNIDGPIYSILKSEVFFIKYENGTKDIFGNETNSESIKKISNAEKTEPENNEIPIENEDLINEEVPHRYGLFRVSFGNGNQFTTVGLNAAFILGNRNLAFVPNFGYGFISHEGISNWNFGARIQTYGYFLGYTYGYIGKEYDYFYWDGEYGTYYYEGSSLYLGKEFFYKNIGLVTSFGLAWGEDYFNTSGSLGVVFRM